MKCLFLTGRFTPLCLTVLLIGVSIQTTWAVANSHDEETFTEPIIPILECVEDLGNGKFKAVFGYDNPNSWVVKVPWGQSRIIWNGSNRKKKVFHTFQPGLNSSTLEAVFDVNTKEDGLKWLIRVPFKRSKSAYADANSEKCFDSSSIIPLFDGLDGEVLSTELQFAALSEEPIETNEIFQVIDGKVIIEVVLSENADPNQARSLLESLGFENEIPNPLNPLIITGQFPISNLDTLNDYPELFNDVHPSYNYDLKTGLVNSQGDLAQASDLAREAFGFTGANVSVGIMSDSYNTLGGAPTAVANGDLPGSDKSGNPNDVQVLLEPNGLRTDEGQAMAQIVHDIAPGADILFRTAVRSAGDFAAGILELAAAGADLVVDDVTIINEPFLKDGTIAQAVNQVNAQGVHYFSAAGNYFDLSSQHSWSESPTPLDVPYIDDPAERSHNFSGGDDLQSIRLGVGVFVLVLQWEDNHYSLGEFPGAEYDLNIWIVDESKNLYYQGTRNNIGEDPIEVLAFNNTEELEANIMVTGANVPPGTVFKYILFKVPILDGAPDFDINEYQSNSSTIVGQANALGANTVGAVLYTNSGPFGGAPSIASFSSLGGTPVDGIVRPKPSFAAPNGVDTTVPLGGIDLEGNGFPNFFGTSAAAPHAAGIAALLLEGLDAVYDNDPGPAKNEILPANLTTLLQNAAIDMEAPGFDNVSGAGFLQGYGTLSSIANPTPEILNLIVPDDVIPGEEEFILTIEARFTTDETVPTFRGEPMTVTDTRQINEVTSEYDVQVNTFLGNPPFSLVTEEFPGTIPESNGGSAESKSLFDTELQTITIRAENKTKKYGEALPEFTYITEPALSPAEMELLPEIEFVSLANSLSDVGVYFIQPQFIGGEETPAEIPVELTELYEFEFEDGALFIDPLEVEIVPNDLTLTRGDKVDGLSLQYNLLDDEIDIPEMEALLQAISENHQSQIAEDTIAIIDRALALVNRALALVNGTAWSISENALNRALALVNGNSVIEVDVDLISELQTNPDGTSLNRALALVNAQSVVDGTAIINSRALALVNRALALVNAETVNDNSNDQVVVIVDENDEFIERIASIFLITGLDVTNGEPQYILPPVNYDRNLICTYGYGELTILPPTLTISIASKAGVYGSPIPEFNAEFEGFVLGEAAESVFGESGLEFKLEPEYNGAGTYSITAGLTETVPDPFNYVLEINEGTYTEDKAVLTVIADEKQAIYGDDQPMLTAEVLGLLPGDEDLFATEGIPLTLDRSYGPAGTYDILVDGDPQLDNYLIDFTPAILTVSKASLEVLLNNLAATYGDPMPELTAVVNGLKDGDTEISVFGEQGVPLGLDMEYGPAGSYTIGYKGPKETENYVVNSIPAELTVNKAFLEVIANQLQVTYGDDEPDYSVTLAGLVNGDTEASVFDPVGGITYSLDRPYGPFGRYTITPFASDPENYDPLFVAAFLTVDQAVLTVTADDLEIMTDEDPVFTSSITGFKFTDDFTSVFGSENIDYTVDPVFLGTEGTYTITPSIAEPSMSNYRIEFEDGVMTVIEDDEAGKFKIFPIPASTNVYILVKDSGIRHQINQGYELRVLDSQGMPQQVSVSWYRWLSKLKINVRDLAPGMYFVKLSYGSTTKTFTILKE